MFKVVVASAKSLAEMIQVGNYDHVNSDITSEHFPVQGKEKVKCEIELICYGRCMQSDDVVRDLESRGMRPATLFELLAFGAQYPEQQREFPVVALGSVWQDRYGDRWVAYLDGDESDEFGRYLCLGRWVEGWLCEDLFAAIRK